MSAFTRHIPRMRADSASIETVSVDWRPICKGIMIGGMAAGSAIASTRMGSSSRGESRCKSTTRTLDIDLFHANKSWVCAMVQTSALEFQLKFGEFQDRAQREPVEITEHGKREFVLMSADHYDWLVAAAQRTHRTTNATAVIVDAVERSEMDAEHAPLDELLK